MNQILITDNGSNKNNKFEKKNKAEKRKMQKSTGGAPSIKGVARFFAVLILLLVMEPMQCGKM